jgi:hypothetical protein
MAEGLTPEQKQMLDAMFESFAKLRGESDAATKTLKGLAESTDPKDWASLDIELKKLSGDLKQKTRPEFMSMTKEFLLGKSTFQSMQGDIDRLREAAKNASSEMDRATIEAEADRLQELETRQKMRAELTTATIAAGKAIADGAAKGIGTFVRGLQDGASGTQLASGLMTSAVDMAAGATKAAGAGMQGVGSALMMVPGPARAVGVGLQLLGGALSFAAETTAKFVKFGIEVMSKEVEKTVKAFNEANASGAIFADGMMGMRRAAADSGLTIDQFSKVISENSAQLAASGLGVAEGARQVGRVGKIIKDSGVQDKLLKLGFSFEEQAALSAETIANMRQAAGGRVSDKQVAQETEKYASNLRLLSALTGEDAKKKAEQVKQQNNYLAFQQKLAGMDASQRAQINAAMAKMTAQEQQNFRDRMVFGAVINREGAIYEATISGAREKGEEAMRLAQANNLTVETVADLNAKYGEQIKQSILGQEALGIAAAAGAESVKGAATAMTDALNQANTDTAEAVTQAKDNVKDLANTTDEMTTAVVGAAKAAQDLKIALEQELAKYLPQYAKMTKEILETVRNMIREATGQKSQTAQQDDLNWAKMTGLEKIESGAARGIEKVGKALDTVTEALLGFKTVDGTLGFFNTSLEKVTKDRVAAETKYLEKQGRAPGRASAETNPAAGTQTGRPVERRAIGGPVGANIPYLVGENGPELFVSEQAGSIVPNDALRNKTPTTIAEQKAMTMMPDASFTRATDNLLLGSKNFLTGADRFNEPVDFLSTDFGGKLFDSLQASNNQLLTAGTSLSDSAKQMAALKGSDAKVKESYTINGKPVSKEQFDKFMQANPELASMMQGTKAKSGDKDRDAKQDIFGKMFNKEAGIGAAIGTAILPGIGTVIGGGIGSLVGQIKEQQDQNKTVADSVKSDVSSAFGDQGPIANFFKAKADAVSSGAQAGMQVGGPVGAAVGALTGWVSSFVQDKDAEKKRLADEASQLASEKDSMRRGGRAGSTEPDVYKGMLERFDQLILTNEQQMKMQQEMLDTMARHKDVAERHYQSSL